MISLSLACKLERSFWPQVHFDSSPSFPTPHTTSIPEYRSLPLHTFCVFYLDKHGAISIWTLHTKTDYTSLPLMCSCLAPSDLIVPCFSVFLSSFCSKATRPNIGHSEHFSHLHRLMERTVPCKTSSLCILPKSPHDTSSPD